MQPPVVGTKLHRKDKIIYPYYQKRAMKQKWKVLAIIYVVEFLSLVYLLHLIGLLDSTKTVSEIIVGILVGFATVFIHWGVIRYFDKKDIIGNLLSEIKINQKLLQPLSDSVPKALDRYIHPSEDYKLPEGLYFEKSSFSALSGKLGVLDEIRRTKLFQYYSDLKYIEEEYKKFENISGVCLTQLSYDKTNEKLLKASGRLNCNTNSKREEFLRYNKKTYDLGQELLNSLIK